LLRPKNFFALYNFENGYPGIDARGALMAAGDLAGALNPAGVLVSREVFWVSGEKFPPGSPVFPAGRV
jgi:hypothetical protein